MTERSKKAQPASGFDASADDDLRQRPGQILEAGHAGAMPLLELELPPQPNPEEPGEISASSEDSNPSTLRSPLLGTICSSGDVRERPGNG